MIPASSVPMGLIKCLLLIDFFCPHVRGKRKEAKLKSTTFDYSWNDCFGDGLNVKRERSSAYLTPKMVY